MVVEVVPVVVPAVVVVVVVCGSGFDCCFNHGIRVWRVA